MCDLIRSGTGILSVVAGLALACPALGQAYRVRELESVPGEHVLTTTITDAGDVVGRVGDSYAVWQNGSGFGRTGGLTLLQEIDSSTATQASTNHADEAGYWYGSKNGQATVWSQGNGHELLELIDGRA